MTDPEDLLRSILTSRADEGDGPPTPLARVAGTAHRIRVRRRLATTALAAAAVVVVAVPLGIVSTHRDSTTAPAVDDPTGPPRIGYAVGHVYVAPDGTRTTLQVRGTLTSVTPYAGGWVVTSSSRRPTLGGNGDALSILGPSGEPISGTCGQKPVVSDTHIAWTTEGCDLLTMRDVTLHRARLDGSDETEEQVPADSQVVGLIGDRVVLSTDGAVASTDLLSSPVPIPDLESADVVLSTTGIVIGYPVISTDSRGPHTRVIAVQVTTGAHLWASSARLGDPSPDGRHLLDFIPSFGGSPVTLVDALTGDGGPVIVDSGGNFSRPQLQNLTWEDASDLLGVLTSHNSRRLIRIDLEGVTVWRGPALANGPNSSILFATTP